MRVLRSATLRVWFVVAALALAALSAAAPASAAPGTIFFTTGSSEPHIAQLWSVREDGTRLEQLRRQMPVGPEGGVAALARNGKRIFCICRRGEIGSVRADGTHLRRLGPQPRGTRYDVVTLSATGSAFWVERGSRIMVREVGSEKNLFLARVDPKSAFVDERVVPSPDGRRVAFVVYGCLELGCPEDFQSVVTVRLDGGGRTVVYSSVGLGKEIYDLAWSPDGSRLIFSDGTGGEADPKGELPVHYPRRWLVAPADGSNPAGTIVPLPEASSNPFFSPDGSRLALAAYDSGRLKLAIAALDGTAPMSLPGTACRFYCEFAPRPIAWAQG